MFRPQTAAMFGRAARRVIPKASVSMVGSGSINRQTVYLGADRTYPEQDTAVQNKTRRCRTTEQAWNREQNKRRRRLGTVEDEGTIISTKLGLQMPYNHDGRGDDFEGHIVGRTT